MMDSVASRAPIGPPDTGASTCSMPRASSAAAMRRAASGEIVAMSTTTEPAAAPSMMPCAPSVTSSQSAAVVTMVTTISDARATAAGDAASCAPAATSSRGGIGAPRVNGHGMAGLEQIERHRRAHRADADEAERARSWLALRGPAPPSDWGSSRARYAGANGPAWRNAAALVAAIDSTCVLPPVVTATALTR